jgi:putative FmdB family regulatory protein
MPTYEYECDACGHRFERLQSMSEPAVRKCPQCRKLKVRRLISGGAGVIFKGSGFYETDYKRNRGGAAAAKKDGEPSESKSETVKADTKPEKKDDAKKPAAEPKASPSKDKKTK